MTHIAIFASGSGTNAQRITEYFSGHPSITICLVLSNKADAFVLQRAASLKVPSFVFTPGEFREEDRVLEVLRQFHVDFIVLAGFLLLVPPSLVKAFPGRIVNIHPALLPGYGGKGMYGHHVHEAVIAAGETESGISIHYVNEHYDEGDIIFQARCPVMEGDTPETLAARIHLLEYQHYPLIIEQTINNQVW
ncbi:MAG: phosphoribosylglycinamide formyltransferase [Bacteroidetes bacterium]|nr:phosphoribosylglycinamide formyltransferase [Bacteroidota bacterium]